MRRQVRPRSVWLFFFLLCLVSGAAFAGYQRIFSVFAPYDDEGYVMMSLRSFMEGKPLYDETFSQYGPAYYLAHSALHRATGLPITHDVTRLKTLALWLLVAAVNMGFIYRMTHHAALSLVAFLLIFFHLERLSMEPGHPQELCILAVSVSLLLATYVRSSSGPWPLAGMGIAVSIAAMTKINVGAFMFVGISVAALLVMPRDLFRKRMLTLFVGASLIMPILILGDHILSAAGIRLPLLIATSLAASIYAASRICPCRSLPRAYLYWYWAAFAFGCVSIGTAALVTGTTFLGLLNGMVLQHRAFGDHFGDLFCAQPPVYLAAVPFALLALLAAVASLNGYSSVRRVTHLLLIAVFAGVCIRHFTDTFMPLAHGADDRGHAALLVSFVTPIVWVLLVPLSDVVNGTGNLQGADSFFGRLMLCIVAILLPLAAFPIPGSQMALGSLGVLLSLLIAISDHLQFDELLGTNEAVLRRGPIVGAIALSLFTLVCRDCYLWRQRESLAPLGLPGAQRMRLPMDEVLDKRWTVEQLRCHADTFIYLDHGYNSLYFWTQIDPPTAINTTLWYELLSAAQQTQIVRALSQSKRPCLVLTRTKSPDHVVRDQTSVGPDNSRNMPLLAYVQANFKPYVARGETEIWVRNVPPTTASAGDRHRGESVAAAEDGP